MIGLWMGKTYKLHAYVCVLGLIVQLVLQLFNKNLQLFPKQYFHVSISFQAKHEVYKIDAVIMLIKSSSS